MAVRGHFASQGTVAGSKNGYGAQQIELGFLVGGAPDAEPLQHILLPAALQVAQLEQVCTVLAENGYVPLSGPYRNFTLC